MRDKNQKSMKKINLMLIALFAIILGACTDDTNEYATKLFTDSEMNRAFRQCLEQSADTANAHLCVPGSDELGFYVYADQVYRIGLPTSAAAIKDTLVAHEQGDLIDSLITKTNLAAEYCGNALNTFYSNLFSGMSFVNPYTILNGDSTALTTYFQRNHYNSFFAQVQTLMTTNMQLQGATAAWNDVITAYYQITGQVVSIDYPYFASKSFTDSFIKEMKLEETLIRKDASRRGETTSKLYEVFATID